MELGDTGTGDSVPRDEEEVETATTTDEAAADAENNTGGEDAVLAESEITESESIEKPKRVKKSLLPLGRVKIIMKSDSDVKLINPEALLLVAKATEMFVGLMTVEAHKKTIEYNKKIIQRKSVDLVIKDNDLYEFLDGAIDWDI